MAKAASKPRSTRSIWPIVAAGVVGAVVLAVAPAYVRAAQTLTALEARDEAAIARLVDFPALRADLEKDLSTALDDHYDAAGASSDVKVLASMIVSPFLNAVVDKFATPRGLAAAADAALGDEPKQGFGAMMGVVAAHGEYAGPAMFRLELGNGGDAPTVLVFARHAVLDWRLAGIDLPPDALHP